MKRDTTLLLMCGLPGSGKTTHAKHLETELSAVRLCPDEWLVALGHLLTDEVARDHVERLQWRLGQRLLAVGQTVILESGFWSRAERDEKRLAARALGVKAELCFLDCEISELARRVGDRHTANAAELFITEAMLTEWSKSFEAPTADEQELFD